MSIEDRYELGAPLEEGPFGTLYRAVDLRRAAAGDRAEVTVWVSPGFANASELAAIGRDLERLLKLDHPNIARVLDVGQDGDRLFVVSELADGETLRNVLDALAPERLDVREADVVIESLGSALAYAKDRGVVHGDVRAENVIVTRNQRIQLTNFRLLSAVRGTRPAATLRDDSRGLAAVAHELYSGTAPFDAEPAPSGRPQQRRLGLEPTLAAADDGVLAAPGFLALAGLECDDRFPQGRSRRATGSRSSLLLVWSCAVVAAIGVALYASDEVDLPWRAGSDGNEPHDPQAAAGAEGNRAEEDAAVPAGEQSDDRAAAPSPTAALPVTARTAAPARRTEPEMGTDLAAARDTAVTTERPDAPASAVRAAPASAPRRDTTLSAQPVTARESAGVAKVTVVRSGDLRRRLAFVWHTVAATARAGDDYADLGARAESFSPGEAKRTLYVPLASDSVPEPSETFYIRLDVDGAPGARTTPTTAEIRIIDDDSRSARR